MYADSVVVVFVVDTCVSAVGGRVVIVGVVY